MVGMVSILLSTTLNLNNGGFVGFRERKLNEGLEERERRGGVVWGGGGRRQRRRRSPEKGRRWSETLREEEAQGGERKMRWSTEKEEGKEEGRRKGGCYTRILTWHGRATRHGKPVPRFEFQLEITDTARSCPKTRGDRAVFPPGVLLFLFSFFFFFLKAIKLGLPPKKRLF